MLGGYLMAVDNKKAALEAAMKNIKKKFDPLLLQIIPEFPSEIKRKRLTRLF